MKVHGSLDLLQNPLLNVALQQVENFPETPKVGSFIFKAQRVMICVEMDNGLPIWAPLTSPLNTHIHDQAEPAVTWVIEHALNTASAIVQIVGSDGKFVVPDEVDFEFNRATVTFYEAQAGRAVLMLGNEGGSPRETYVYEQEYANSAVWVVNHMLGYEPLIRVFMGNQEIQPQSITHNDINTTTVTFSQERSGLVRCI